MFERNIGASPFRNKTVEFANRPFMPKIVLWQGDLLKQTNIGAIINPSNTSLRAVNMWSLSSKIEMLGGKELIKELDAAQEIKIGDAFVTGAYNLEIQDIHHIIHVAGPIYPDYQENQEDPRYIKRCRRAKRQLPTTYKNIFKVARENNITSFAIPAISTGTFDFPKEDAARIVRDTVYHYFNKQSRSAIKEIRFILYTPEDYDIYEKVFSELAP